jgi:hypothetical protein
MGYFNNSAPVPGNDTEDLCLFLDWGSYKGKGDFCDPKGSPARTWIDVWATNDDGDNWDKIDLSDYKNKTECDSESGTVYYCMTGLLRGNKGSPYHDPKHLKRMQDMKVSQGDTYMGFSIHIPDQDKLKD